MKRGGYMEMADLIVLTAARCLAALYMPIQDSDEVYNFWEPTHFVTEGWGLQTWEWSPEFAIRSWAYVAPHAAVIATAKLVGLSGPGLFWTLRLWLGLVSSAAEHQLALSLGSRYGASAKWLYVAFAVAATGMMHASVSYLPSSLAMYCTTLGAAKFISSPRRNGVAYLGTIALGGLLGWPFALAIAIPWGLWFTVVAGWRLWATTVVKTAAVVSAILLAVVCVDSAVYRRLVVVPFNIVAYNVLDASEDAGPGIFGTEPWWFYLANLALNFNVQLPLALVLLAVGDWRARVGLFVPLVAWIALFSVIPHKEERFMYVVYPLIPSAAAIAVSKLWKTRMGMRGVLGSAAALCVAVATITAMALGLSRSAALSVYYTAPYEVWAASPPNSTICVGREWYRFPSSYFLPSDSTFEFVPSGFDGLLPGKFVPPPAIPPSMNNRNIPDPTKISDIAVCDYIVELGIPVNPEVGEFDPTAAGWQSFSCRPFLDAERTPQLARLLWLGESIPAVGETQYIPYCMFEAPRDTGKGW